MAPVAQGPPLAYEEEVTAYEAFLLGLFARAKRSPPERSVPVARRRAEAAEARSSTDAPDSGRECSVSSSTGALPQSPDEAGVGVDVQETLHDVHSGGSTRGRECNDLFYHEVALEEEILARSTRDHWERGGLTGAAVVVRCGSWAVTSERLEPGQAFFGDALNAVALPLLRKAAEESPSSAVGEGLEAALHPLAHFLGSSLMHYTFPVDACCHFQALIDLLIRPEVGLEAVMSTWFQLDRSARSPRLKYFSAQLKKLLQDLLLQTKRVVEAFQGDEEVQRGFFYVLCALAELVELPVEQLLPEVQKDASHLRLCVLHSNIQFSVVIHRTLQAGELCDLLVQRLCFPGSLRLLWKDGEDHVVLPDNELVATSGTVFVSSTPDWSPAIAIRKCRMEDPVYKVNTFTATRLLAELRSIYAEPDFFRDYHQLRLEGQGLHVDKAIGVQSVVLPRYGFDGSRRGVMEMRRQVSALADRDAALGKALRDIHQLLDAHQPLPSMPVTKGREAPRFHPGDVAGWTSHLADEGFVVLAGVADPAQVNEGYKLLWDFLENSDVSGRINRADVRSWQNSDQRGAGWPAGDDGIIGGRGVGQSQVMWFLRSLPQLRRIFSQLWGTELLVTSFDGAGVFRPYGHDSTWKTTKRNWFHLDQAHYKRGLHCVQGLLTLKDATEETGGLVVVPGSHRFHNDVMRRYEGVDAMEDFVRIDITDPVLVEGGQGPMMVVAKAGDLVLWDSRTVHCNTAPLRENRSLLTGPDLIRAVAYICMTPAAWCGADALAQRRQGVEAGVTTKHWPHEYHPKSTLRGWNAGFTMSSEQWSLVSPAVSAEPREHKTLRPGRASCRPPSSFKVTSWSSDLRNAATTKWATPMCSLRGGEVVDGYAMGRWLRLSRWPQELGRPRQSPEFGAEDDVWALLSDFEPC